MFIPLGGLGGAVFATAYLDAKRAREQQQGLGLHYYNQLLGNMGSGMLSNPPGMPMTSRVPHCAYCGMKYYEKGRCQSCGAPEGR